MTYYPESLMKRFVLSRKEKAMKRVYNRIVDGSDRSYAQSSFQSSSGMKGRGRGSRGGTFSAMDSEDKENDEDRILKILSGYETVLLSDLHKMVGNQHLGTICSDIHKDDVLVNGDAEGRLRDRNGEYAVRYRGSDGAWTNKYDTDRERNRDRDREKDKQRERERDKERDKEKAREKDSAKDAAREKNDELKSESKIAARISSEVESMKKKMEKNHLIEMKRLSEEIKTQRTTINQLNRSKTESESSLEVAEKNLAISKKEKEVLLERKAREASLYNEMASLKKKHSGAASENAAKVAKLEARIITLMRSNAEEKDNLRLEFGARRKKECSEFHREIRELKRKLLVDGDEIQSSKKVRRDSSGQHSAADSTLSPGPESVLSPRRTARHADPPHGASPSSSSSVFPSRASPEALRLWTGSGPGSGSNGAHSERALEADRGETHCTACYVSLCM